MNAGAYGGEMKDVVKEAVVMKPDGEILRLTEGSLAPVACLEADAKPCAMSPHCRTLPMWNRLNETINQFFDSYTIADLMQSEDGGDYVI